MFSRNLRRLRESWRTVANSQPLVRKVAHALYWLPIAAVFTEYFYTIKLVTGRSMQPTLNPGTSQWRDVVIFDRMSVRLGGWFARGDIVSLKSPINPKMMLVKRILAVEGDVVNPLPPYPDAEVRVPEGHIWVEGDEPFRSVDSNRLGPVPLGLVDAKLVFIIWPFTRFGPLPPIGVISNLACDPPAEREALQRSRVQVAGTG